MIARGEFESRSAISRAGIASLGPNKTKFINRFQPMPEAGRNRRRNLPGLPLEMIKAGSRWAFSSPFRDAHSIPFLPKNSDPAFLHRNVSGFLDQIFVHCKAAAPLSAHGRTRLGRADRLQPAQYYRAPRRLSHPLRPHLGAGAKNSRSHPKSLRAESRRTVRAFSTSRRRDQDVDQGRHRARAGRQGGAFPRAHSGGGDGHSRARRSFPMGET